MQKTPRGGYPPVVERPPVSCSRGPLFPLLPVPPTVYRRYIPAPSLSFILEKFCFGFSSHGPRHCFDRSPPIHGEPSFVAQAHYFWLIPSQLVESRNSLRPSYESRGLTFPNFSPRRFEEPKSHLFPISRPQHHRPTGPVQQGNV